MNKKYIRELKELVKKEHEKFSEKLITKSNKISQQKRGTYLNEIEVANLKYLSKRCFMAEFIATMISMDMMGEKYER